MNADHADLYPDPQYLYLEYCKQYCLESNFEILLKSWERWIEQGCGFTFISSGSATLELKHHYIPLKKSKFYIHSIGKKDHSLYWIRSCWLPVSWTDKITVRIRLLIVGKLILSCSALKKGSLSSTPPLRRCTACLTSPPWSISG
jgi:hypothetical protein